MAERYVGLIKGRATSYLAQSRLPLRFWFWACSQAAAVMRFKALDVKVVKGAPTFGDSVMIRLPNKDKQSFQMKAQEATFLTWSPVVPMGAWVFVRVKPDAEVCKVILVSLPEGWSKTSEVRWNMKQNPISGDMVWINEKGDI